MKRKISANIELKAIELKADIENYRSTDHDSRFLPSEVISCYYEYPLKIMLPHSTSSSCCQWIYPVIFGGGLVEGDNVNMSIKVGSKCCALLTTLSFPKNILSCLEWVLSAQDNSKRCILFLVYCCENGLDSQQHMKLDVCSHALLCVLPDPLVCYKSASHIQTQSYYLAPDANVVSLDWFTSGRYERGESWDFTRLKSMSTFYVNKKLVFKESQDLQNSCLISIKDSMKSYNCFGTCIVLGPSLSFLYEKILSQLGKHHAYGEKYQASSLFAASPLYLEGVTQPVGCIVRFSAESVPQAVQKMEDLLEPLLDIFGENPFRHK